MEEVTRVWRCASRRITISDRPLLMGIVNATPDSFSDGGQYDPIEQAERLIAEGADLLDIGGESTRPGSLPVPVDEELRRVIPVIQSLARQTSIPISVDTSKVEVARQALDAGAVIINDVTGFADRELRELARQSQAGLIVMHMQGTPATMQIQPHYENVVTDIRQFLESRCRELLDLGIDREQISIDPGIGFGKTVEQNMELLANLNRVTDGLLRDRPLTLGVSRKGLISKVCGRSGTQDPIPNRVAGSLAIASLAMVHRTAQILRVHDVQATRDVISIHQAWKSATLTMNES